MDGRRIDVTANICDGVRRFLAIRPSMRLDAIMPEPMNPMLFAIVDYCNIFIMSSLAAIKGGVRGCNFNTLKLTRRVMSDDDDDGRCREKRR